MCYLYLPQLAGFDVNVAIYRIDSILNPMLEQNPEMAKGWAVLANSKTRYAIEGEGAREDYERAISLNPNIEETYLWYGEYLRAEGDGSSALAMHLKALELSPRSLEVLSALGVDYSFLGQTSKAKDIYQRMMEIDPFSPGPYVSMAQAALQEGRVDSTIYWYRQAVTRDSLNFNYRMSLVMSLLALDLTDQIDQHILKYEMLDADEYYPITSEYYRQMQINKPIKAAQLIEDLIERRAFDFMKRAVGESYYFGGDCKSSMKALESWFTEWGKDEIESIGSGYYFVSMYMDCLSQLGYARRLEIFNRLYEAEHLGDKGNTFKKLLFALVNENLTLALELFNQVEWLKSPGDWNFILRSPLINKLERFDDLQQVRASIKSQIERQQENIEIGAN